MKNYFNKGEYYNCQHMYFLEGFSKKGYRTYCRVINKLYGVATLSDLKKIKGYINGSSIDSLQYLRQMLDTHCPWIPESEPTDKLFKKLSQATYYDSISSENKLDLIKTLNGITSTLPVPDEFSAERTSEKGYTVKGEILFDPRGLRCASFYSADLATQVKALLNKDLKNKSKIF